MNIRVKKSLRKYKHYGEITREYLDSVSGERINNCYSVTSNEYERIATDIHHIEEGKGIWDTPTLFIKQQDMTDNEPKVKEFLVKNLGQELGEVCLKYVKKDMTELAGIKFAPRIQGNEYHNKLLELGETVSRDEIMGFTHVYHFGCGCSRTYSASPFTMDSKETLYPCAKHKTLHVVEGQDKIEVIE